MFQQRDKPAEPLRENPYFHRGPIKDHRYFYGRKAEVRRAFHLLRYGQCVSIVGPRRVGKTSLLFHICAPTTKQKFGLTRQHLFVYVDGQVLGHLKQSPFYHWVWTKLLEAGESYGKETGIKIEEMLIELDGSELRTAKLMPKENSNDKSAVRQNPKKEKIIGWHEVRIGLARPINSATKIYIGKMDVYPAVVNQLFNASVLSGMSPETKVIGIADGGNGLKEELENQFENLEFILDKTHLKDHLYETAEELAIDCKERRQWVDGNLSKISKGHVDEVIEDLEAIYSKGKIHRVKRLIGYLRRFIHSVNYEEFKEKGYPIGSGEVESAHKSIPQKRMKIPGACWHVERINPMLSLRVLRANGWWDDYWQDRTNQKLAA